MFRKNKRHLLLYYFLTFCWTNTEVGYEIKVLVKECFKRNVTSRSIIVSMKGVFDIRVNWVPLVDENIGLTVAWALCGFPLSFEITIGDCRRRGLLPAEVFLFNYDTFCHQVHLDLRIPVKYEMIEPML